jgi:hypothetical protein
MPDPINTVAETNLSEGKSTSFRPHTGALDSVSPEAPALFSFVQQGSKPEGSSPQPSRTKILRQHFFRRFFDNDTLSVDGETQTSVIRALAFCAVPGFMFAFWLLPSYPGVPPRSLALMLGDRYFFVLYSFVVMGIVATFEWETLFPDRADFLILLPMPLQSRELFYAKASALAIFLGIFLIATNLFACILYPAVSTHGNASPVLAITGHFAAVLLAGIFSALTTLAAEGLLISFLPPRWFRPVSSVLQSLSITILGLLLLLWPLIAHNLSTLLSGSVPFAKFLPPIWFMALYERLIDGDLKTPGIAELSNIGLYATAIAAALCLITYPLGWARQKKRALEGVPTTRGQSRSLLASLLHKTLLRRPQQRAVFHFLTQTLSRSPRYQVYMALYSGAGLALALCTVIGFSQTHAHTVTLTLTLSSGGLHAVLPLLLFWLVAGLRAAFSFPVDMLARWIFPIGMSFSQSSDAYPAPYAYPGHAAKAARTFTLLCCAALIAVVLGLLLALHWSWTNLLVQAVYSAGTALLLTDLFFLGRTQIPFTRTRPSSRAGWPVMVVLYFAFFPAFVLVTTVIELTAEQYLHVLVRVAVVFVLLHLAFVLLDRLLQHGIVGGFPEDETDEGPITLGLTQ